MPKTRWSVKLKGARGVSQRPPVVVGDHVLLTFNHGIGDYRSTLLCVEIETGRELWRFEGDHSLNQPLIVEFNSIFISSFSGALYKLDMEGNLVWKSQPSRCSAWKAISCHDVVAYPEIAGQAKITWGLSKEDGSTRWMHLHGGHAYSLASNSDLIVGSSVEHGMEANSSTIYCVEGATGTLRWETIYPRYVFRPTILKEYVFVGSRGCILCINLLTGVIVAQYEIEETVAVTQVPLATPWGVVFCAENGTILSLNLVKVESGVLDDPSYSFELNWKTHADGGIESEPIFLDRHIFLIGESGKILILSAIDGQVMASASIPRFERGFGLAIKGRDLIVSASREALCIGSEI
ncbi:PQQ-binding-like beta-propeller repeat protein [Paucibacter sp. O1-1]|nr:PQQ-binding-like beta-propeller repeat protein [Paucibacter sp. O1-1]MDA3825374.1 PQQ-binding-like beta-propeller repeat protein [Paucibacter sp. O1-1]